MRVLVHFVDEWPDFRLPELHALLQLAGLKEGLRDKRLNCNVSYPWPEEGHRGRDREAGVVSKPDDKGRMTYLQIDLPGSREEVEAIARTVCSRSVLVKVIKLERHDHIIQLALRLFLVV
jgi:hypothetical protein